jgi:hypothetical protein
MWRDKIKIKDNAGKLRFYIVFIININLNASKLRHMLILIKIE